MPGSSVSTALGTHIKSPTQHRIRGQHFLESVATFGHISQLPHVNFSKISDFFE